MNIALISGCSTEPPDGYVQQYFSMFQYSAKKLGYDPIILKKPWLYKVGTKTCICRDFIKEEGYKFDIIICSDAYDVVFQLPKDEFVDRFLKFNSPIVFSAELNCSPQPERDKHRYPKSPTPYAYVNGGFIVGYTSELLNMFNMFTDEVIEKLPNCDDQDIFTQYYLNNQRFGLDHYQLLCQNMFMAEKHIKYEDGVFKNIITNSIPCVFHGNGGKESILPIIDTLYSEIPKIIRLKKHENLSYIGM